jgi:putative FmdB family regulatory protein
MPLYEYECQKCGERFEQIQKFSDPPVKKHEGCGGKVRKLLSAPAIQFKGTGWYVTDYGRAGKPDPERKADAKAAKQESKQESKKEAKAETSTASESKASSESSKTTTSDASKK